MIASMPEEAAAIFRAAVKEPIAPTLGGARERAALLDRAAVEALLPHRDPFLLVDEVTFVDLDARLIAGRYDLARASDVLAGHFPGRPLWPGVLQLEAVGQAGLILSRLRSTAEDEEHGSGLVTLTDVLGARFARPVMPGGHVDLIARSVDDGLFTIIVGQCLQGGAVCSVAAIRGIAFES